LTIGSNSTKNVIEGARQAEKKQRGASNLKDNLIKMVPGKGLGLKVFDGPDLADGEEVTDVTSNCLFLKTKLATKESINDMSEAEFEAVVSMFIKQNSGYNVLNDLFIGSNWYQNPDKFKVKVGLIKKKVNGPYSCMEIGQEFGWVCQMCPHFGKVTSPIEIKGEGHIKSKKFGFYQTKEIEVDGKIQTRKIESKPDYEGLARYYHRKHPYITVHEQAMPYIYRYSRWEPCSKTYMDGFAHESFNPKPNSNKCDEFRKWICRTNLESKDIFDKTTEGKINLANGVYDYQKGELLAHSPKFGFMYCLPYDFDLDANCPRFYQFLDEITCGDHDMQEVLMELVGYAISGGECKAQKAGILYGEGSNGKSTLLEVLKALAGDGNYSSLSLTALNNDQKRALVEGKLFNLGEETSPRALGESEVFKTMVTGGEIDIKRLYGQPYSIKNRAKLIMACNELPKSSDRTHGLYRRMLTIPFNAVFEGKTDDPDIKEKLLKELPGIFNLAIQGLNRLREQKWKFSQCDAIDRQIEDYKIENDNVLEWLKENCEYDKSESELKDKLYSNYRHFCEERGTYPQKHQNLMKRLAKAVPGYEVIRKSVHGEQKRAVKGIKLR